MQHFCILLFTVVYYYILPYIRPPARSVIAVIGSGGLIDCIPHRVMSCSDFLLTTVFHLPRKNFQRTPLIAVVFVCSIDVSVSFLIAKQMQRTRHLLALHSAASKAELPYTMSTRQTRRTILHSSVIDLMALLQRHKIFMR